MPFVPHDIGYVRHLFLLRSITLGAAKGGNFIPTFYLKKPKDNDKT
jgi:hypothetical protein